MRGHVNVQVRVNVGCNRTHVTDTSREALQAFPHSSVPYTSPLIHLTRTFHRYLTFNPNNEWHRPMKEYRGKQQYSSTYSVGGVCVASRNFTYQRGKPPAVYCCNNRKRVKSTSLQRLLHRPVPKQEISRILPLQPSHHNHNHPYSNYNTLGCLVYLKRLVCESVVSWKWLQQMAVPVMKQSRGTYASVGIAET